MRRTRLLTIFAGLLLLGLTVVIGVWPDEPEPAHVEQPKFVQVAAVSSASEQRSVRFGGVTRAAQRALLSFGVPGHLASRSVNVGDAVTEGQELAALERQEFANAVRLAEAGWVEVNARYKQARRDNKRAKVLFDAGALPEIEAEHANASVRVLAGARSAAYARLIEARRVLHDTQLRAPYAGSITAVHVEPGEFVGPGRPVIELSGSGGVRIEVEVPESIAPDINKGDEVFVELPLANGIRVPARIDAVARASERAGKLFLVGATLDAHPEVTAGMTGKLVLVTHSEGSTSVPLQAVLNPGSSQPFVFRVNEGRAQRVPVEVRSLRGGNVLVRGSITASDKVIVAGQTTLADGDPVEVGE